MKLRENWFGAFCTARHLAGSIQVDSFLNTMSSSSSMEVALAAEKIDRNTYKLEMNSIYGKSIVKRDIRSEWCVLPPVTETLEQEAFRREKNSNYGKTLVKLDEVVKPKRRCRGCGTSDNVRPRKMICSQCDMEKRNDKTKKPLVPCTWKVGDELKESLAASFARAGWGEAEGLECKPLKRKDPPTGKNTYKVGDKLKESLAASFARANW